MNQIQHQHHQQVDGFICPDDGKFVVPGHFLDRHDGRCHAGHARTEHSPALQVVDIYVIAEAPSSPHTHTPTWSIKPPATVIDSVKAAVVIDKAYLDWAMEDRPDDYSPGMSFGTFALKRLGWENLIER